MSGVWFLTGFEIKEIDSYGTKTWTKMKKRHKICNIEHLQPPNYGILLEKYDFAKIGRNDPKFVGSLEKWGKICRESGDRDPPFKGLNYAVVHTKKTEIFDHFYDPVNTVT